MAPHFSTLAWKIPWMEESGRLGSMGLLRVGHDWATNTFTSLKLPLTWEIFFSLKKILFIYFNWRLITLQYCGGFCHTFTWISHGCTCVPHPEPHSHLPPHPISQGHPSVPALSTLYHALNLDWQFISHMILYMFQCYSLKSSHPRLLPQSPKDCSIHLCLFCCLATGLLLPSF